jgi:hypothetical protein
MPPGLAIAPRHRVAVITVLLGVLVLALGLSVQAASALVVQSFDADGLTRRGFITNELQADGVVFSSTPANPVFAGMVIDLVQADFGFADFGNSSPYAVVVGAIGEVLTVRFVLPDGQQGVTDFVSVRMGDGDESSESFRVTFFDASGVTLTTTDYTTSSGPIAGGVTITFSAPNIGGFDVSALAGSAAAIDDLAYNAVHAIPAPAAFVMMAVAVLAATAAARWPSHLAR